MQIENHKEEVPFAHYAAQFAVLDPAEAAARTGCAFDGAAFSVRLLGTDYRVAYPSAEVRAHDGAVPPLPLQTFLLRLLLLGKTAEASAEFKTFRELPWGEVYIKPFTGRVLTRAAFTFGTRLAAFRAAAARLGGLPLKNGDAGYEFTFFDNYRLRLIVWEGDDEFPPNAQLLYTATFADGFAAEDRVVAGDLLISALKSLIV